MGCPNFDEVLAITGLSRDVLRNAVLSRELTPNPTDDPPRFLRHEVVRFATARRLPWRSNNARLGFHLPLVPKPVWRAIFTDCWLCQMPRPRAALGMTRREPVELHHIERRSHADRRLVDLPENWFAACREHHAGDLATMPHAEQLAIKFYADCAGWGSLGEFLSEWEDIAGYKAAGRITVEDVLEASSRLGLAMDERGPIIEAGRPPGG